MAQITDCTRCGARLASDFSAAGLCPACLLAGGLVLDDSLDRPQTSAPPGFVPNAVFGAFQIGRLLGKGGMAAVYEARERPPLARTVALKVLPREFLHDETFAQRFIREAHIVASLEHPSIVPIYASGIEAGVPWLSMRLLGAGNLGARLAASRMDLSRATRILLEVADALDYAHARGVVHRDVKPTNILLDDAGRAYVCDFGLAHAVQGSPGWTSTGVLLGTPLYMAPEQAAGLAIDHRCDIYSLGVVAYEILTGALPFTGPTALSVLVQHLNAPVPEPPSDVMPAPTFAVVKRALAKHPGERWPTARAFIEALEESCKLVPRAETRVRVGLVTAAAAVLVGSGFVYWRMAPSELAPGDSVSMVESRIFGARNLNMLSPPADSGAITVTVESRPSSGPPNETPSIDVPDGSAKPDDRQVAEEVQPGSRDQSPPPAAEVRPVDTHEVKGDGGVITDARSHSGQPPPSADILIPPKPRRAINPAYPPIAKAAGIQGNVLLRATVGPDGRVVNVEVTRSVHPVLDEVARRAVLQFEYSPGLRNGTPATSSADVVISFRLSE